MTREAAYAVALLAALAGGWLVPALAMRALAPSLGSSSLVVENYRGRKVFLGLGLVWAVWAVSLFVATTLLEVIAQAADVQFGSIEMLLFDAFTMPLYVIPVILTLAAVVLGMADDVFGTGSDKGFRGHVGALAKGRLTTGGLKLLGIGLVAAVHAWRVVSAEPVTDLSSATVLLWWAAATAVIALSANLVNLLDLRPGRALKAYSFLAVVAAVVFVTQTMSRYPELALQSGLTWGDGDTAVILASLLIVLLGPVLAVWRYDLGEMGMLGDAGSNAMGAVVGYLLARSLPLPWLTATAILLLGLNLLSEKLSFSRIISAVPPLRYIDGLGRQRDEEG